MKKLRITLKRQYNVAKILDVTATTVEKGSFIHLAYEKIYVNFSRFD